MEDVQFTQRTCFNKDIRVSRKVNHVDKPSPQFRLLVASIASAAASTSIIGSSFEIYPVKDLIAILAPKAPNPIPNPALAIAKLTSFFSPSLGFFIFLTAPRNMNAGKT